MKLYKNKRNIINEGMALPMAMVFTIAGLAIFSIFLNRLIARNWEINYKIAKYKATLNAHSGVAHMVSNHLYLRNFTNTGEDTTQSSAKTVTLYREGILTQRLAVNPLPELMGSYRYFGEITPSGHKGALNPHGWSEGSAIVKNVYNMEFVVKDTAYIELTSLSSLSDFLYLTDSEKAGGAPHVFNNFPASFNRREVNFGPDDIMNADWAALGEDDEPVCDVQIKTNGTFVVSDFGCPSFENTVTIIEDEDGNVNYPDLGTCQESTVFNGDPPLDTLKATCLPPEGYDLMKYIALRYEGRPHIVLDALSKMNWQGNYYRDTLIMTDIEFFPGDGSSRSGVKVKQWWYLMPPYLEEGVGLIPNPGVGQMDCAGGQLYQCDNYINSMKDFHAKNVATNSISEDFIDEIVQGTYGFHFYDIPNIYANNYGNTSTLGLPNNPNNWESQLNDAHLLLEYQNDGHIIHYYEEPTAIYVKGGPVRIHGTYKGQWTVVTDESTPYHRHAWGTYFPGGPIKIDTLWNNIWLIDDIVNDDFDLYDPPGARQSYKSLRLGQPEEVNLIDCTDESDNVLGIVSGANVYVANTAANGARNQSWGRDIDIHAHIIAFNESFAVHYFQNNISDLNYRYSEPDAVAGTGSWADGQGRNRWGLGGGIDNRGYINLWGGIVQKFRGYAKRNNGGGSAYQTADIGMDKNYNFDCNLKCNFPPLYPDNIESSSCGELEPEKRYKVSTYY